jgi:hypothetical protein
MRHQEKLPARRGWRQWTEAQAREALDAFRRSGLTASAFARQRGVSIHRLQYWRKRLDAATPLTFVPVSLPEAAVAKASRDLEIVIGEAVLRVPEGSNVEHVARLVAALAGRRPC